MTAVAILAILIPLKIHSQDSYSSQTTTITLPTPKPLQQAILASSNEMYPLPTDPDSLKSALGYYVSKYGGNYARLASVISCESNWNPNAKNPKSTASGISQFLDGTWKYERCEGNKKNPYDQMECMVRMWSEHKEKQWECFTILYN